MDSGKAHLKLRKLEKDAEQWRNERDLLLKKLDTLTEQMASLTGQSAGRKTNIVATTQADIPHIVAEIHNELLNLREAEHLWHCRFTDRHSIMLKESHEVSEFMRQKAIRIKVPLLKTNVSLRIGVILAILADVTIRALEYWNFIG